MRLRPGERLFRVPRLHRKAAQAWLDREEGVHGSAPRYGAAVVFVRDGSQGVEVLMVHRGDRIVTGSLTFPGGVVEFSDDEPLDWAGANPHEWSCRLLSDDIGHTRRVVVAAARKAFVDAGVLFAGMPGDGVSEHVDGADWMNTREALASGEISFAQVLAKRRLTFYTQMLRPLAHWVTSDFVHQRVDVQYFTSVVPVGQTVSQLDSMKEHTWVGWVNAAQLLEDPESTPIPQRVRSFANPHDYDHEDPFRLYEVTTPGVQMILEQVAQTGSSVAFLAARRDNTLRVPQLESRDGEPVLVVRV